MKSIINIVSGFDAIFSGVGPRSKIILIFVSFAVALVISTPPLLVFILPVFGGRLLLSFPSFLTHSGSYQLLPANIRQAIGYGNLAVILGWLLYISLAVTIIFTKRSLWLFLYLLFIFLLLNNVAGCRSALDASM